MDGSLIFFVVLLYFLCFDVCFALGQVVWIQSQYFLVGSLGVILYARLRTKGLNQNSWVPILLSIVIVFLALLVGMLLGKMLAKRIEREWDAVFLALARALGVEEEYKKALEEMKSKK